MHVLQFWLMIWQAIHHHRHHFLPDLPTGCATLVSSGVGTFVPNKPVPQCATCAAGYGHFAGDNVCVSKYHTYYIIEEQ